MGSKKWPISGLIILAFAADADRCGAQGLSDELLERLKHSAVMVRTSSSRSREGDTLFGTGSGFFVNKTGLCISNNHVVDPGHHKSETEKFQLKNTLNRLVWTVVTDSGTDDEKEYTADVLYQNEQADLAVLQVKDEEGEFLATEENYLRFRPTSEVTAGLKAWCLGFPGGDARKNDKEFPPVAITSGNVVNLPRSTSGRIKMLETDVLANPGNSGGPFVDQKGRLIGVLTLGAQTEARANTTMLIPGDLVQEMILTAFRRGKVHAGVDLEPFFDLFVRRDRTWELPLLERVKDRDCLTLDSGSRVCGKVAQETLTLPSPLGQIEVPTSAMAYIDGQGEKVNAFLDGGDRFVIDRADASIRFAPEGGEPVEIDLDDVEAIAFRRPDHAIAIPKGSVSVITGRDYNVSLQNIAGELTIESDGVLGKLSVGAADIVRIVVEDLDRVFYTRSGSRLAGDTVDHKLTGTLAWSASPVTFSYQEIQDVDINEVNHEDEVQAREIPLTESLQTSDPRLVRVAESLDNDRVEDVGPLLEELFDDTTFRALAPEKKDQARFLKGEYLLRKGQFGEAAEEFKTLKRAKVESVLWHARARLAVLDRYQEGKFENASITEVDAFKRACLALAAELAGRAAVGIDGMVRSQTTSRGDYSKLLKHGEEIEEELQIASRLTGGESEEFLVYLWRVTAQAHTREIERLSQERIDQQEQLTGPGPGGRPLLDNQRRNIETRIGQIDRDIEKAQEANNAIRERIGDAGFIIDDPDNLALREL